MDIGINEEKASIKVNSETMERFSSDLSEITASQQREIAQLRGSIH